MDIRKRILIMTSIAVLSIGLIAGMYIRSEREIHHDNPFIRRYVPGSVERVGEMELPNNSLYFAGTDSTKIYLADSRAPLHVFEVDTLLKSEKHHVIQLEDDRFPFKRVVVRVVGKDFYVFDGSVPLIFKGSIYDWKAKIVMKGNNYYFTQAEVMAGNEIAFKNYDLDRRETVIGKFNFNSGVKVSYAPGLLQKQIDGLFDVEGTMRYNPKSKKFIYLYSYRNQFSVTDKSLNLLYRGNTIDTNAIAKIKVSHNKDSGITQLASATEVTNKMAVLSNNLLFVNSTVRGKYESKSMWETASIVDIYNIRDNTYLSSTYIYDNKKFRLRDMIVVNSNLFALVGNQIHRYTLNGHLAAN